jgi:hypothetical protein
MLLGFPLSWRRSLLGGSNTSFLTCDICTAQVSLLLLGSSLLMLTSRFCICCEWRRGARRSASQHLRRADAVEDCREGERQGPRFLSRHTNSATPSSPRRPAASGACCIQYSSLNFIACPRVMRATKFNYASHPARVGLLVSKLILLVRIGGARPAADQSVVDCADRKM